MSRFLVVSRTNEDCGWILSMFRSESIIYNHGRELQNRFLKIQPCPNGGEVKAFLTYIADWYDQLADVTIFVTASLPLYLERKSNDDNTITADVRTAIEQMTKQALSDGTSKNDGVTTNTEMLQRYVLPSKSYGLSFGEWFYQYYGHFPETEFHTLPSCCFAVRKDHIHHRPKQFYQYMLQQLTADYGETRIFFSQSWFYAFNPWNSRVPLLPDNIAVVCYGVSKIPYQPVGDSCLYTIDAFASLQMISKYVLEALKRDGKNVTVYVATNPHADIENYAKVVEAQYVKTKGGMTSATAWNDCRRLFPKLWYDHPFIIAIHLDALLLQSIDQWNIDPTQLNYEGSCKQIQAFSTSAAFERRMLPSFFSKEDAHNPLFTTLAKNLPTRK